MSYDIQIRFRALIPKPVEVIDYINSLPNVTNMRFVIGELLYMEIDIDYIIEREEDAGGKKNCINFHIPYSFWDNKSVDHDPYLECINTIATKFHERALDLQFDLFTDSPEYEPFKVRGLAPNLNASYDEIDLNGNILTFNNTRGNCYRFTIDLNNFLVGQETEKNPSVSIEYEAYRTYRHTRSSDNSLLALTKRREKIIKIFPGSRMPEQFDDDQFAALWEGACDTIIQQCGDVKSLAFSTDNKLLFSVAYRNKSLKLWDVSTKKPVRSFSCYARSINIYKLINDRLLCVCSGAGISFFDYSSGNMIVHISPLDHNWIVFTESGDYQYKLDSKSAVELDWIDNDNNESYVFMPGLGFAYYQRRNGYKLNKLKEAKGFSKQGLLEISLKPYLGE